MSPGSPRFRLASLAHWLAKGEAERGRSRLLRDRRLLTLAGRARKRLPGYPLNDRGHGVRAPHPVGARPGEPRATRIDDRKQTRHRKDVDLHTLREIDLASQIDFREMAGNHVMFCIVGDPGIRHAACDAELIDGDVRTFGELTK